jgi:hypothetical protein
LTKPSFDTHDEMPTVSKPEAEHGVRKQLSFFEWNDNKVNGSDRVESETQVVVPHIVVRFRAVIAIANIADDNLFPLKFHKGHQQHVRSPALHRKSFGGRLTASRFKVSDYTVLVDPTHQR